MAKNAPDWPGVASGPARSRRASVRPRRPSTAPRRGSAALGRRAAGFHARLGDAHQPGRAEDGHRPLDGSGPPCGGARCRRRRVGLAPTGSGVVGTAELRRPADPPDDHSSLETEELALARSRRDLAASVLDDLPTRGTGGPAGVARPSAVRRLPSGASRDAGGSTLVAPSAERAVDRRVPRADGRARPERNGGASSLPRCTRTAVRPTGIQPREPGEANPRRRRDQHAPPGRQRR